MRNYSKELVRELQPSWMLPLAFLAIIISIVGSIGIILYGLSIKNRPNFQTITGEQKDVSFSLEDFKRDIKSGALTPLQ